MNGVSPKVTAGAGAGGASGMLAVILVWVLGHWMTIPPEIATAMAGLIVIVCTAATGYLVPHDAATAAAIAATTDALKTAA